VSEFQDAIANALSFNHCYEGDPWKENDDARAILAMPEMQAVREFLLEVAIDNGATDGHDSIWRLRDGRRVPESVIEWVLS
jgi:hypothetical protein